MRRIVLSVSLCLAAVMPAAAQSPAPTAAKEPPLRRYVEFQQFVLSTRYRFIRNNADVTTSNHQQYREQIRVRFNIDRKKRLGIVAGAYSGSQFIASWNNLGPGTGTFDGHNHYMRQLYATVTPVAGVEGQVGGIYVNRGETTEYTSYDDDGYLVGGRVSVRRPKSLYFDEVTLTRAALTQTSTPNLWKRWTDFTSPNYTQLLVAKRLSAMTSASADYTRAAGLDTLRGGVALRFKAKAPLSALRYEQYARTSGANHAAGFAVTAERPITKYVRLQGGYTTIDEHYGNLNADRIQRGRRFFAVANVPIKGPLSASIFATRALHSPYTVSNKVRFDAVLAYDVAAALRSTGKF
jgi:hypothetical protein